MGHWISFGAYNLRIGFGYLTATGFILYLFRDMHCMSLYPRDCLFQSFLLI